MPVTELRADCSRCTALCCVALPFTRSADFAIDKPAGTPCRHLDGFGCGIHDRLRPSGFAGCTVFDCFGAGQRVVQERFAGADWRSRPELAGSIFATFGATRILHELLVHLAAARSWPAAAALHAELDAALATTETLAATVTDPADAADHRTLVAPLLRSASAIVRGDGPDLTGADLAGRDLRRRDLRRTTLRGALLIGADLRNADLERTDLLGADLRGTDLRGADLTGSLYLTAPQTSAARGDSRTRLPERFDRPLHWA